MVAKIVAALIGLFQVVLGFWALLAPRSFASQVAFPFHLHFLHDVGAFQIGIGATLLAGVALRDSLVVVLTGFLIGNTIHVVNHVVDLDSGGHVWDIAVLGVLSMLAGVALAIRVPVHTVKISSYERGRAVSA